MTDDTARGRELHREFVGMLFALAIAEVAVRAGGIVNSDIPIWTKAPAVSHLLLAAMVIATSWVGWGWSKHSLSNVTHVFTGDFVELTMDVWLVCIYFFIVQGAETIEEVAGHKVIQGSSSIEALWVMVMFVTYLLWDLWTKFRDPTALLQRGWASVLCSVLAVWSFMELRELRGTTPVVLADGALLGLLFLFRAMKIHDLREHTKRSWLLIAALAIAWATTMAAATNRLPVLHGVLVGLSH